jgi:hypothetical protein
MAKSHPAVGALKKGLALNTTLRSMIGEERWRVLHDEAHLAEAGFHISETCARLDDTVREITQLTVSPTRKNDPAPDGEAELLLAELRNGIEETLEMIREASRMISDTRDSIREAIVRANRTGAAVRAYRATSMLQ